MPTAKSAFILEPQPPAGWRLRSVKMDDGELLRRWKNANRQAFFHQQEISPEQQLSWLGAHLQRDGDYLFMLEVEGRAAGCLGWRLLEPGLADIYNVMWGVPGYGGQGLMGRALLLMCAHILAQGPWPIMAKVVAGNPALGWYLKNGFVIADRQKGHDEVKLDLKSFAPPAFRRLPA